MSTELTPEEKAAGFIRPMRTRVKHKFCGTTSILRTVDALDMARDPTSWSTCWCMVCGRRLPADQFEWFPGGEAVGS
jgi:hypothetical protein